MKLRRLHIEIFDRSKSVSSVLVKKTNKSPKIPDIDCAQSESLDHPLILGISVTILVCSQSMSNALHRVDDRTCKVVRWVNFPFIPVS
jgi:hypothetical protein